MSIEMMNGLLRDFGAGIGLPDLAPDDQGYCCLMIGEAITLSLQYEPEEEELAMFARIGHVDDDQRGEACEMLLAGNLFWAETKGGTLAFEPASGSVFLMMKDRIQALDGPRFNTLLTRFVEAAEEWRQRLRALGGEAALAPPAAEAPARLGDIRLV
jgi:Tir chaperone family protein CesT